MKDDVKKSTHESVSAFVTEVLGRFTRHEFSTITGIPARIIEAWQEGVLHHMKPSEHTLFLLLKSALRKTSIVLILEERMKVASPEHLPELERLRKKALGE